MKALSCSWPRPRWPPKGNSPLLLRGQGFWKPPTVIGHGHDGHPMETLHCCCGVGVVGSPQPQLVTQWRLSVAAGAIQARSRGSPLTWCCPMGCLHHPLLTFLLHSAPARGPAGGAKGKTVPSTGQADGGHVPPKGHGLCQAHQGNVIALLVVCVLLMDDDMQHLPLQAWQVPPIQLEST